LARHKESAVLTMSDLHYGKKTSSFNLESFEERLEVFGDRLVAMRESMAGYDFDELVVCLLGDVNDGTGIYATQPHHQAESNVEEQAEQLSELLAPWFRKQKKVWKDIRLETIPGNHGLVSRFCHEAANWDIVTYKYLKAKLERDGIQVGINRTGNKFLRKVQVRKHHYLLYHGHDIHSFANIPWYGMMNRISRWVTTKLAPIDVVMMGHFHTHGCWSMNRLQLLCSGTMITDDDWALQTLGWESANKWWLFGVSDKRPITWSFGMDI
jgi:DNA polymerase II small subunit/DNA polymerase delta subunit B